jgi:hypothetical protein
VLRCRLASVKRTQALSGSSRVACITSASPTSTSEAVGRQVLLHMLRRRDTSVPTTKRMCIVARAGRDGVDREVRVAGP